MTDLDLTGRKALVTGGAQGLGEGMARALASAGATVVIADLQDDVGTKVAGSLGGDHGFVYLDTTDDANWESAVAEAVDMLGGLDVVVNNAGVEITSLLVDLDPVSVRKQLEGPNWSRLVQQHRSEPREDTDVYMCLEDGKIKGIAVIASEPREFTIVNVIGNLDVDKISQLPGQFGIPKISREQ